MQFSYKDYYKFSFEIPLIILVLVLIDIVFEILRLTNVIPIKMNHSTTTILLHYAIIIVLSLFGAVKLSRSYSLAKEKEVDSISTQGVIQDITKMPFPDKYYHPINRKVVWSQYIVINNIKYYCMTADYVEIGMTVEIKYLPTSKYVLEIERI